MQLDWGKKIEDVGALWRMNHDAEGAHAKLTSGKHSDAFINCTKIVEDPMLVMEVAGGIIEKLEDTPGYVKPEYVVGPAYGAITFAYEVARQLGVKFAFTEIVYTEDGKMQELKRFDIPRNAKTLVIEDVATTGGSAMKTVNVLSENGVDVLPMVGLIMNWSGQDEIEGNKLVALITAQMMVYEPENCTLCKEGSEAVRPKSSWDLLAR